MMEVPTKLAPLKVAKEIELARLGQALRHLHDLLPLKERQQSLDKPLVEAHRAILRSLVERGRALTGAEIAGMLGGEKGGLLLH